MFHEDPNEPEQQFQTAQNDFDQDISQLTSTKQQFRKTIKENVNLKFQKISHHSKHHLTNPHKNYHKNISFESEPSFQNYKNNQFDQYEDDGISSLGYYYENHQHAQLVYKKTRNIGTKWIGQKQYFTSLFANPQLIEKSKTKSLFGKFEEYKADETNVNIVFSQQKSASSLIQFDSDFQSGNLFGVYKVGILQYDLLLQNDINTKGNTQWFYFRIKNPPANKQIKLNIVNFRKSDSLFNYGMLPCLHSSENLKKNNQGWTRKGSKVKYFRNSHHIQGSRRYYYTLTFTIMTEFPNDTLRIAQCYPYTLSDFNNFVEEIYKVNYKRHFCQKTNVMPKTLGGNKIDSLVIKESNPKFRSNDSSRPLIILFARQHPGQTPGSFMIEGMIDYLLSKDKDAQYLRKNYQIRAIPMVNPDGVQAGNYRTNLYGVDLNRKWDCSTKQKQMGRGQKQNNEASQIIYIKRYLASISKGRQIAYIIDFHGHSRKLYSFFYGNSLPQNPTDVKMFPFVCSKLTSMIRFQDCTFSIEEQKRSTARIQLFNNLKATNIYTFEASFFGYIAKNKQKKAFTIQNYKNLGLIIGKAIYICQKRKQETQIQIKEKFLYEKWFKQLTSNSNLLKVGENEDSGSQSCPEQCEIRELQKRLLQEQFTLQQQQQKRRSMASSKGNRQKFRHDNVNSAKQPLKSLRQMQVLDIARVNSIFPNDVLALVPNNFYLKSNFKPKAQMKNAQIQTDPCPIIKIYQSCKVAQSQLFDQNLSTAETPSQEKSVMFERTKARSVGQVLQNHSTTEPTTLTQTCIKNFSALISRPKTIHEKQLFQNVRHLTALKKSTQIRKNFKKVLTEHQLSKPKSQLPKNDSTFANKKVHQHSQTVISFSKQAIKKQNEIVDQVSGKDDKNLLQKFIDQEQREKLCESKFLFESPQKIERASEQNPSKFWTIESKRKSLGVEIHQFNTPMTKNQFRKTTFMNKNLLRSTSNNFYQGQKLQRNDKIMENWRIKKKSLI